MADKWNQGCINVGFICYMHKNTYDLEPYIVVNSIKKNVLAKVRLSDHKLKIQSGRQTKPITPRELRRCSFCPHIVEDEAHFLFECSADRSKFFVYSRLSTWVDIFKEINKLPFYQSSPSRPDFWKNIRIFSLTNIKILLSYQNS